MAQGSVLRRKRETDEFTSVIAEACGRYVRKSRASRKMKSSHVRHGCCSQQRQEESRSSARHSRQEVKEETYMGGR